MSHEQRGSPPAKGLHPGSSPRCIPRQLVMSLVLFPSAAAFLRDPGIVTGGAACRVPGSTQRAWVVPSHGVWGRGFESRRPDHSI